MDPTLLSSFASLYRALRDASLGSSVRGQGEREHRGQAAAGAPPHAPEAISSPSAASFLPPPLRDRADAGQRLAEALAHYRDADLLIVSLSGGGAVVAAEISRDLRARLDLLLVRKVRCPLQPDLAIGFVVDGPALNIFRDDHILASTGLSEGQFWDACQFEVAELRHERERYLGDRPPLDAKGRVLIVVDDGRATEQMMRAALRILRMRDPRRIVIAVPAVSMTFLDAMRGEADEIVHLALHDGPSPTFHTEFTSVTREQVVAALVPTT
jgi:putative phosphoribosyl transferase